MHQKYHWSLTHLQGMYLPNFTAFMTINLQHVSVIPNLGHYGKSRPSYREKHDKGYEDLPFPQEKTLATKTVYITPIFVQPWFGPPDTRTIEGNERSTQEFILPYGEK